MPTSDIQIFIQFEATLELEGLNLLKRPSSMNWKSSSYRPTHFGLLSLQDSAFSNSESTQHNIPSKNVLIMFRD